MAPVSVESRREYRAPLVEADATSPPTPAASAIPVQTWTTPSSIPTTTVTDPTVSSNDIKHAFGTTPSPVLAAVCSGRLASQILRPALQIPTAPSSPALAHFSPLPLESNATAPTLLRCPSTARILPPASSLTPAQALAESDVASAESTMRKLPSPIPQTIVLESGETVKEEAERRGRCGWRGWPKLSVGDAASGVRATLPVKGSERTARPERREMERSEVEVEGGGVEGVEGRDRGAGPTRGNAMWRDEMGPSWGSCVTDGVRDLVHRLQNTSERRESRLKVEKGVPQKENAADVFGSPTRGLETTSKGHSRFV